MKTYLVEIRLYGPNGVRAETVAHQYKVRAGNLVNAVFEARLVAWVKLGSGGNGEFLVCQI